MTRRFVAVGLPDTLRGVVRDAVGVVRGDLQGLRFTDPGGWHVTLAFLGELPDERVPDVVDAVRVAIAEAGVPRQLEVRGAGSFGDSVLWCGVIDEPDGILSRCADAVQRGCAERGLDVARRPLTPHITIARRRARRRVIQGDVVRLGEVIDGVDARRRCWSPHSVDVMSSTLGEGPARYAVDEEVEFPE